MKYRLVPGRGLPLKGLAEFSIEHRKKSTLLSKKRVALVAALGTLAALFALYRSLSKRPPDLPPDDKEAPTPETSVLSSPPPSISEPDQTPEKTFKDYVDDLVSRVFQKKQAKESDKPSEDSKKNADPSKVPPKNLAASVSPEVAAQRESSLLSKGKFSPEERAHIKLISQSGVSTAATVGRQMPPEVRAAIIREAEAAGIDPVMMLKVASLESGGNPHAISATGAVGVFQFTSATASDFGLTNRFDMVANVKAAMQLTNRSIKSLGKSGLGKKASSALAIYISHQIGAQGAKEVLSKRPSDRISSLSKSTQKNIRANIGGDSKTVGQYLKANEDALESKYDGQVASNESPVPVTLSSAQPPAAPVQSAPIASAAPKASAPPSAVQTASVDVAKKPTTEVKPSPSSKSDSTYSPKEDPPTKVASSGSPDEEDAPTSPDSSEKPNKLPAELIRLRSGQLVGLG